jgi:hypothetical protein
MWGSWFKPSGNKGTPKNKVMPINTTPTTQVTSSMLAPTSDENKIGNIVALSTDLVLGEVSPQLDSIINNLDFNISTDRRHVAYQVTDLLYYIIINSNNITSVKLYLDKVRQSWDKIMINFPQLFEKLEDGKMSSSNGKKLENLNPRIIELLKAYEVEQNLSNAAGKNSITFSEAALKSGQEAKNAGLRKWSSVNSASKVENSNKALNTMIAQLNKEYKAKEEELKQYFEKVSANGAIKMKKAMEGFEGGRIKRLLKKKSRQTRRRTKKIRR